MTQQNSSTMCNNTTISKFQCKFYLYTIYHNYNICQIATCPGSTLNFFSIGTLYWGGGTPIWGGGTPTRGDGPFRLNLITAGRALLVSPAGKCRGSLGSIYKILVCTKITKIVATRHVLQANNRSKFRLWLGFCPGSPLGELTALPHPPPTQLDLRARFSTWRPAEWRGERGRDGKWKEKKGRGAEKIGNQGRREKTQAARSAVNSRNY